MQLVLQTEASLASQITNLTTEVKDLLEYFKKLEADLVVTNVVQTERQCSANAQYSRRDTVQFIGISSSISDQDWKAKCAINRRVYR